MPVFLSSCFKNDVEERELQTDIIRSRIESVGNKCSWQIREQIYFYVSSNCLAAHLHRLENNMEDRSCATAPCLSMATISAAKGAGEKSCALRPNVLVSAPAPPWTRMRAAPAGNTSACRAASSISTCRSSTHSAKKEKTI